MHKRRVEVHKIGRKLGGVTQQLKSGQNDRPTTATKTIVADGHLYNQEPCQVETECSIKEAAAKIRSFSFFLSQLSMSYRVSNQTMSLNCQCNLFLIQRFKTRPLYVLLSPVAAIASTVDQ